VVIVTSTEPGTGSRRRLRPRTWHRGVLETGRAGGACRAGCRSCRHRAPATLMGRLALQDDVRPGCHGFQPELGLMAGARLRPPVDNAVDGRRRSLGQLGSQLIDVAFTLGSHESNERIRRTDAESYPRCRSTAVRSSCSIRPTGRVRATGAPGLASVPCPAPDTRWPTSAIPPRIVFEPHPSQGGPVQQRPAGDLHDRVGRGSLEHTDHRATGSPGRRRHGRAGRTAGIEVETV